MTRVCVTVMGFLCLLGGFTPVVAQEKSISVSDDAKFVLQLDLGAFRSTELGSKLLELTQQMAQQEIGDESEDVMAQIEEAVGFNPFEEIRNITVISTDYENPEEHLRIALQLGQTTGNLEGLMLAAPGYEAEEVNGVTVHSAHEDDMQAYVVIHSDDDDSKTVLAATSKSEVLDMLKGMSGYKQQARRVIQMTVPKGTFLNLQLFALPEETYEQEQVANIAKMVRDFSMTLGEAGDDFALSFRLTTEDEERAEQIHQLIQGAKALVGLFKDEIGDDEDAKMVMSILDTLNVVQEHDLVSVEMTMSQESVMTFLREEADLPL